MRSSRYSYRRGENSAKGSDDVEDKNNAMNEIDDITLERAKLGEEKALSKLLHIYSPKVHALVCRMMVGQPACVDDLCQEALVKVLKALPDFDPRGRAKLSSWILTITLRTCIDECRRKRPWSAMGREQADADIDNPEQIYKRKELSQRIEKAMAALPEDQRAVLVLRAYHDFDYQEIAEALGIEPGTVKSRLARARLALRQLLPFLDAEGVA